MTAFYSSFFPAATGAKGSAAFTSSATNSATIYLYKRSAVELTITDVPNGNVVYTFATAAVDLTAVTNGWTTTIPSGEDQLYIVSVFVSTAEPTVTIETIEWTAPALLGSVGLSTATVYLYQRNDTGVAPSAITTDVVYTFATGALVGTYAPWTQTIPESTNGRFLFITTALAVGDGAETTILAASWTAPRLFSVEGQSPAIINLTNDSVSVPANADGSSPNLAGATTTVSVFEGGSDVTASWTITATPSSGVTGSLVGNNYTVSTFTVDAGSVTFTATRSGYLPLSAVFSLSKAKAGLDGDPVTTYEIRSSLGVIKRNNAGAYTTPNIVFSAFSTTGSEPPVAYSGRFIIATSTDGVNYTDRYTSATNQSSYSYSILASINFVRVRLYLAGGTTTLIDEEVIPVADDGTLGINSSAISIYQRATTAPAVPSVTTTYTFSSGVLTGLNNGWTQAIPASNGNPLWVSQATATGTGTTDTILNTEWSAPQITEREAISAYLTNEASTVFAYANGNVVNYNGATGTFVIVSGTTDISTNFTLSTAANPQNLTVSYVNRTYTITGGLDPNEDTATLTIRATGSGAWAGVTIDKVFTLAKTRGGYEIVSDLPGVGDPRSFQGNVVFLTDDNKLYRFDGTNWTTAVPAPDILGEIDSFQIANNAIVAEKLSSSAVTEAKLAVGAVTNEKIVTGAVTTSKLFVVPAGFCPDPLFSDSTYWETIEPNERGPVLITLYARGSTRPTLPTPTYNFLTGALTSLGVWSSTIPGTGTGSLWVITALAYNNQTNSTTYTFTTADWASVASGSTTVDTTNKIGFRLYLRNNTTAPAMPTGVSYNFNTQTWTLPTNWSITPQGWVEGAQNLWVVYGSIVTTSTSGTPTYGLTTPRRGEFGSWYLESNSTVSNTMGVPRMYALWSGVSGPITFTRGIFSRPLPFSGRGQQLRLRANTFNQSNQSLNVEVQFLNSSSTVIHTASVVAAAGSNYSVPSTITTVPFNLNIASYRFVIFNAGGTALSGAMSVSDIKLDTAAGAELIVDGSITTDKIQANAINADKIQAGAITTSKLLVGDMSILNRNSDFEDGDVNWVKEGNWTIRNDDAANARNGTWVARITGTGSFALRSTVIPTQVGEAFTCDGWLKTSASGVTSCVVRISGINSVGSEIWTAQGNVITGINTNYTRSFGTFTVPVNVVGVRVEVVATLTGGTVWADNIRIIRAATGELIVDGAITANKIGVGEVKADNIFAGAVTAAKIGVTELSAIAANVGTLTAGAIQNAPASNPNPTFRIDVTNGRTITQVGTAFMKVTGAPFGSTNQFIEWYGPFFTNLSSCTEANAIYYLKTNGSAYFGGSLSAGILKNAVQSSLLASNASVETGNFSSNGGTIQVVLSFYSYSESGQIFYPADNIGEADWDAAVSGWGATPSTFGVNASKSVGTGGTTTVALDRSVNNGAFTNGVTTLNITTGTETIFGPRPVSGDSAGFLQYTRTYSASLTYTDPQTIAQLRNYRARLTARGSGILGYSLAQQQLISIVTTE